MWCLFYFGSFFLVMILAWSFPAATQGTIRCQGWNLGASTEHCVAFLAISPATSLFSFLNSFPSSHPLFLLFVFAVAWGNQSLVGCPTYTFNWGACVLVVVALPGPDAVLASVTSLGRGIKHSWLRCSGPHPPCVRESSWHGQGGGFVGD